MSKDYAAYYGHTPTLCCGARVVFKNKLGFTWQCYWGALVTVINENFRYRTKEGQLMITGLLLLAES